MATSLPRRKTCILTGGGDAQGLNAVLRAFVRAGTDLGLDIVGSEDGFESLIQADHPLRPLRPDDVRGILPKGGSMLGCSNRANPFSYPTKQADGSEALVDVSEQVIERVIREKIDTLVLVGGDGTMTMGKRFMDRGISVLGVPKTIDNDLNATDMTFGFHTAVETATWAIDTLHSTAEAHDRVIVVEVMGRYAGWIALRSGIAGGADAILIPEMPYDIERVAQKIKARSSAGSTFSLVVVGEGAHPKEGSVSQLTEGRPGHLPRLGGAGQVVADALGPLVPHEIRVTVLGHLQRGGSPNAFDRLLGTRFGVEAARLCAAGVSGRMVAIAGTEVVDVPIEAAIGKAKLVDPDGELVRTARAIGIEMGAP